MEDAQLIKNFLDGDDSAFNTLVSRWELNIYRFVLRYIGDRDEARDLCQIAFVRAFHKLPSLRDHQRFSSWLYQIALNVCRDESKRKKRKSTFSLNQFQLSEEQSLPNLHLVDESRHDQAGKQVHQSDVKNILQKALKQIPEEQRLVIVMKEYQGLKFTEIADALQISVNTVKSRLYYGLRALRKVLDNWNLDMEKMTYEL